jgi:hypothetical protein
MQLIYLSPVPWASFAQRPHKFVEWFHASTGGDVLWVDPYPTRFPLLSDFHRLGTQSFKENRQSPTWLNVVRPKALPIEPIPASGLVNELMWHSALNDIDLFIRRNPTILCMGKPSVMALTVLKRHKDITSVYDAMDDFPLFYTGFSRLSMRWRERKLIGRVSQVLVSSTALKNRLSTVRPDIQLVANGLDASLLPIPKMVSNTRKKKILGYVGTIGSWFDWEWVIALAKARPADVVRLIGPVFVRSAHSLPENIEMLPTCTHQDALRAMLDFDIGLIPFKINELTFSVDPIKYYEYRALGLPVLSTEFGEMALRNNEEGTFLINSKQEFNNLVQKALSYCPDEKIIQQFKASNAWEVRFEAARIIQ